jgi:hypothetical protein
MSASPGRASAPRVQGSSEQSRISPSSSEVAVSRVRGVNPTRLTCWNEPDSDGLCHDGAFVSDDVHVFATVVNKRHPCCVHVRRAAGIVRLILRHRSCRDKDQCMTRMRVPACGPSRLPDIAQDSPVGQSLRPLRGQPDLGVLVLSVPRIRLNELVKDIECIELALGDRCARESLARCRRSLSWMEGREHDHGTEHQQPR